MSIFVILKNMKVAIAGHRRIEITEKLKEALKETLMRLVENGADTFYFCGTKGDFDYLCYDYLGELMQSHRIKRVLARAYYDCIDEDIFEYRIDYTESRCFPEDLRSPILTIYTKPKKDMIDLSEVLLTYFDKSYVPTEPFIRRSSTSRVVEYAKRKKKTVINIFDML